MSWSETIQALYVVNSNITFATAATDGDRVRIQFPNLKIAQDYNQGKTKMSYVIQHGIFPVIKDQTKKGMVRKPFSFKFEETTTSQVKKQFDAYITYHSAKSLVVTSYCGSVFVGHCSAEVLVEHFYNFIEGLELDPSLFLSVGMDGPNVNKKFERMLQKELMMYGDFNFYLKLW